MPARGDISLVHTRLARKRVSRGMSQDELAQEAGLSLATVRRFERNEVYDPGIRKLAALARVLDCRLTEICEDSWLAGDLQQPKKPRQIR